VRGCANFGRKPDLESNDQDCCWQKLCGSCQRTQYYLTRGTLALETYFNPMYRTKALSAMGKEFVLVRLIALRNQVTQLGEKKKKGNGSDDPLPEKAYFTV
jgi:hypothetical protein